MESEENRSLEKQTSEKKVSEESSSQNELPSKTNLEKQSKTSNIKIPENNQNLSKENTQSLINLALKDLHISREQLENELVELSKKKEQIETELKSSFSGQSDAIARKVKGFQEYLTGALQDLAQSAEQLELVVPPVIVKPSPLDENKKIESSEEKEIIHAVSDTFKPDEDLIRKCFSQFL